MKHFRQQYLACLVGMRYSEEIGLLFPFTATVPCKLKPQAQVLRCPKHGAVHGWHESYVDSSVQPTIHLSFTPRLRPILSSVLVCCMVPSVQDRLSLNWTELARHLLCFSYFLWPTILFFLESK